MGSSGCPSFTSIASNANGFVFGTQHTGSPYTTGASMNAGSGSPFVDINTGNQLGRIDIAVAPSNPNYIYAQGQSIVGIAMAVVVAPLVARSVLGLPRMEAPTGLTWKARKAVRSVTVAWIIRKTGTTRAWRSIRTILTGCF
jgi:hypothetical protein